MKGNTLFKTACSLVCFALTSLTLLNEAMADGTEQLGPPTIPTADGSETVVSGMFEMMPSMNVTLRENKILGILSCIF
jgi:hypothetical protein